MKPAHRGGHRVFIGEGPDRWSLGDPGHPDVAEENRQARLGSVCGLLASITSDMHYLIHTCPTTKLACEKLAQMRAAVRRLEAEETETPK